MMHNPDVCADCWTRAPEAICDRCPRDERTAKRYQEALTGGRLGDLCPRCQTGRIVCATCDDCGERHCPDCAECHE